MTTFDVRAELKRAASTLMGEVKALTDDWLQPVQDRLDHGPIASFPKTLNDAVWGTIELLPHEVLLLDCPMLQRLRGVRQLGMAHLVYPGAGYDRLEHSLGVLEAATRITDSLQRNAKYRSEYGNQEESVLKPPTEEERAAIRLGALLHDIGHSPFSHATEHLIGNGARMELEAATGIVREAFDGVGAPQPAELMAVLFVLSDAMKKVLEHSKFTAWSKNCQAEAIAGRILGSTSFLKARYLAPIVSGALDADKIDYMARDSHHAGLPLGLDITRLVSKLEVVAVTPENALAPEIRQLAEDAEGKRFYELGISKAGLGAYEQLTIARVTLYERLYYHHKVRAAEGMIRNLAHAVANDKPFALSELYQCFSDDALVDVWGGALRTELVRSGGERATQLAGDIRRRHLFRRCYAFSSRFIGGLGDLDGQEADDIRSLQWSGVIGKLESFEGARDVAELIVAKANWLIANVVAFSGRKQLGCDDIVVDLPQHGRVAKAGGRNILVAAETGHVLTPNMFFHADKWGDAYMKQKQCGYVFAPAAIAQLVALASKIVFFERFDIVMNEAADIAAKMHKAVKSEMLEAAAAAGNWPTEALEMLRGTAARLVVMSPSHLKVPKELLELEPNMATRLSGSIRQALPCGLPAAAHATLVDGIESMLNALMVIDGAAPFKDLPRPDEVKQFQPVIRDTLKLAGIHVVEGAEIAGGETDLILWNRLLLENKVLPKTDEPFEKLRAASWQTRRYRLALMSKVSFICAGYEPSSDNGRLPINARIQVRQPLKKEEHGVEIMFVVPCGGGKPSSAATGTSDSKGAGDGKDSTVGVPLASDDAAAVAKDDKPAPPIPARRGAGNRGRS